MVLNILLPLVHLLVSQLILIIIYQAITTKKDDRISSTQLTAGVSKDIYKNIYKWHSCRGTPGKDTPNKIVFSKSNRGGGKIIRSPFISKETFFLVKNHQYLVKSQTTLDPNITKKFFL